MITRPTLPADLIVQAQHAIGLQYLMAFWNASNAAIASHAPEDGTKASAAPYAKAPHPTAGRKQLPRYFLPLLPRDWLMAKRQLRALGANTFTLKVARDEYRRDSDLRARRKASRMQPPQIQASSCRDALAAVVAAINDLPTLLANNAPLCDHSIHNDAFIVKQAAAFNAKRDAVAGSK
jgi:hypothetical protein